MNNIAKLIAKGNLNMARRQLMVAVAAKNNSTLILKGLATILIQKSKEAAEEAAEHAKLDEELKNILKGI